MERVGTLATKVKETAPRLGMLLGANPDAKQDWTTRVVWEVGERVTVVAAVAAVVAAAEPEAAMEMVVG